MKNSFLGVILKTTYCRFFRKIKVGTTTRQREVYFSSPFVLAAPELRGVPGGHEEAALPAQRAAEGSGPGAVRLPGLVSKFTQTDTRSETNEPNKPEKLTFLENR